MALRLRRGTDTERQLITPLEGELIYVTDTKELYAGDGSTVGGIRISGEVVDTLNQLDDVDAALPQDGDLLIYDSATGDWVAGELPLVDLPDVNAAGILDGQVLAWDTTTSSFIPSNNIGGGTSTFVGDLVGSVFADDSTPIIDAQNRVLNIDDIFVLTTVDATNILAQNVTATNIIGDVTGNLTGNVVGIVEGEFLGSVYTDNSTLIIDSDTGSVHTDEIRSSSLDVRSELDTGEVSVTVSSLNNNSKIALTRESASDISSSSLQYGRILFARSDINGVVETVSISGYQDGLAISHDSSGLHTSPSENLYIVDGQFAFGTFTPAANSKVDVAGNLHVTGGYTQFGSLTTTERNALTAAAGMVIWNSTTTQFEGYDGSNWINLVDGVTSA